MSTRSLKKKFFSSYKFKMLLHLGWHQRSLKFDDE